MGGDASWINLLELETLAKPRVEKMVSWDLTCSQHLTVQLGTRRMLHVAGGRVLQLWQRVAGDAERQHSCLSAPQAPSALHGGRQQD